MLVVLSVSKRSEDLHFVQTQAIQVQAKRIISSSCGLEKSENAIESYFFTCKLLRPSVTRSSFSLMQIILNVRYFHLSCRIFFKIGIYCKESLIQA